MTETHPHKHFDDLDTWIGFWTEWMQPTHFSTHQHETLKLTFFNRLPGIITDSWLKSAQQLCCHEGAFSAEVNKAKSHTDMCLNPTNCLLSPLSPYSLTLGEKNQVVLNTFWMCYFIFPPTNTTSDHKSVFMGFNVGGALGVTYTNTL